jgi:hypothetical protein
VSAFNTLVTSMLELLRARPALTVYPGRNDGTSAGQLVPDGATPPYVAVRFTRSRPEASALCARTTGQSVRAYAYCVGATDVGARAVADQVAAAWLDVVPAPSGWVCWPIEFESSGPPTDTEATGVLRVELTEVYRLGVEPA